ncbi:MAG: STAS domain-containing protein [Anaerolineae bacterium]|jgi:rsbT antagonist protein RsbS
MKNFEASEIGETLETFTVVQKLEDLLLVSVPRDLTDNDVLRLRQQVLRDIRRHDSRWVLLDFSLVDICDSFFGRFIHSTAQMAKLMGADVIVAGLQDAVVETMVELGMTLPNIHAVLDLDDALALSRGYKAQKQENGAEGSPQDESESAGLDAFYADSSLDDWTEV